MYRSYSVNNMPEPVRHRTESPAKPPSPPKEQEAICEKPVQNGLGGIFDNLQKDDIILLIVILVLILDDCDDKLLLAALGFIFLSDAF